jgi:accessory colonization factor AcfC
MEKEDTMKRKVNILALCLIVSPFLMNLLQTAQSAQEKTRIDKTGVILRDYGVGGPGPAMREAAKVFGDKKGIRV